MPKQVFEKSSTEAHTRRKIEKYIRDRYEAHQLRGARLSQDDIDYITPYLNKVNIKPEVEAFIEKEKQHLIARRRRKLLLIVGNILIISVAAIAFFYIETKSVREIARTSEEARIMGDSLTQNLSQFRVNSAQMIYKAIGILEELEKDAENNDQVGFFGFPFNLDNDSHQQAEEKKER